MDGQDKLHTRYILGILVAVILLLITVRWGGIPDLVERINFALTLTSLVLSVFAIVYVLFLFSSSDLQRIIGGFSRSVSEIMSSAALLSQSADRVAARADAIAGLLSEVKDGIQATRSAFIEYSQKAVTSGTCLRSTEITSFPKDFVERASITGLLVLLAMSLALTNHVQTINDAQLKESVKVFDPQYVHGFMVAAYAAGIVDHEYDNDVITPNVDPAVHRPVLTEIGDRSTGASSSLKTLID